MQLSVAAGGSSWLVMNAAKAAWNTYLPLMQREEHYADLAGLLLPLLQQLLQVGVPSLPRTAHSACSPSELLDTQHSVGSLNVARV